MNTENGLFERMFSVKSNDNTIEIKVYYHNYSLKVSWILMEIIVLNFNISSEPWKVKHREDLQREHLQCDGGTEGDKTLNGRHFFIHSVSEQGQTCACKQGYAGSISAL